MPIPFFSIITVCLDAPRLEDTCSSIVRQTFQDFEWIVIDGGSALNNLQIFQQYKNRLDAFVSENDAGLYDAMNKGLARAQGLFVNFMNAGDAFARPDILSQAHKTLKSAPDIDVLYGEVCILRADEKIISLTPGILDKNFFRNRTISHQAAFIRKSMFERFGLYDTGLKITADYKHFLSMFMGQAKFARLEAVVAVQEGTGKSVRQADLLFQERRLVKAEMEEFFRD
ncbi:MAG: glycosyltransferase [Desulfovibrionaceae bacterium]|nr:glycosyltransferase [Desulfovibrionaceae bacterium]